MSRRVLLICCSLVFYSAVRIYADEDSAALMQELKKTFSSIQTVQTRFRQEKKLRIFSRTLIMEGRLTLENPSRLAWRIDSPVRYALVLNGDYAQQWDEDSNKIQKTKTAGNPVFEEVLGQIGKWFSGEFDLLLTDYDLVIKNQQPLELEFTPKENSLISKVIKHVTVSVRSDRAYVEQILIEDTGGDTTRIVFYDTVLNSPVSAEKWEVVPND